MVGVEICKHTVVVVVVMEMVEVGSCSNMEVV